MIISRAGQRLTVMNSESIVSKMKDQVLWTALPAFLAIADHGGLTAAAQHSGHSAATLSRHITRLEQHLGKRLFLRGAQGYQLSPEGRALLPLARRMAHDADQIERWTADAPAPPSLRISAGPWTARWLAQAIDPQDISWRPSFVSAVARTDIARRAVDIGIRNARPTQSWLAGQKIGTVRYAVFARDPDVPGWITLTEDAARLPSAQWVAAHVTRSGAPVSARTNCPILGATLAAQGHGRIVLPLFAGALTSGLTRIGAPIDALTSEEWLVSHHEARFDPQIRQALTDVRAALKGKPA